MSEVNEEGEDEEDEEELIDDETDSSEDELQKRFDRMTFVVATKKLEQQPRWVKVTEVFKNESDGPFLKRAGVSNFDDPRCEKPAPGTTARYREIPLPDGHIRAHAFLRGGDRDLCSRQLTWRQAS